MNSTTIPSIAPSKYSSDRTERETSVACARARRSTVSIPRKHRTRLCVDTETHAWNEVHLIASERAPTMDGERKLKELAVVMDITNITCLVLRLYCWFKSLAVRVPVRNQTRNHLRKHLHPDAADLLHVDFFLRVAYKSSTGTVTASNFPVGSKSKMQSRRVRSSACPEEFLVVNTRPRKTFTPSLRDTTCRPTSDQSLDTLLFARIRGRNSVSGRPDSILSIPFTNSVRLSSKSSLSDIEAASTDEGKAGWMAGPS